MKRAVAIHALIAAACALAVGLLITKFPWVAVVAAGVGAWHARAAVERYAYLSDPGVEPPERGRLFKAAVQAFDDFLELREPPGGWTRVEENKVVAGEEAEGREVEGHAVDDGVGQEGFAEGDQVGDRPEHGAFYDQDRQD